MRFLLDAHVSGRRIGERLARRGHDVFALDAHAELEGLDDEDVLALATEEDRILVTFNVADFPEILRGWAEAGRSHAGVMLVYGIRHSEVGLVAGGIERWTARRPAQVDWVDFAAVISRG
jgi:NAD(P)-dependent dehydrogenase (short-subunit alcohol dehydrogenase family)